MPKSTVITTWFIVKHTATLQEKEGSHKMSRFIKRKIKRTTAEVYDENGKRIGTMEVGGQVSAPRMANIARRDKGNPLLTVRNVITSADTYVMGVDEFVEYAERMGTIEPEPEPEADGEEAVSE